MIPQKIQVQKGGTSYELFGTTLGTGFSPLWLYLLAEAEVIGRETSAQSFDPGEGLGPVGATIVAETLIGLIELDEASWLGENRNWTPVIE